MSWNIKELEDAVRNTHGDQYAEKIHDSLLSFAWKSEMAYLHAYEAEQILKEAVAATPGIKDQDPQQFAFARTVIFSAASCETGQNLRLAQFRVEAHIIASAQALRSLCDIICYVVYWAYKLDTEKKAPALNKLNLYSIFSVLKKFPQYATTASRVKAVADSQEFKYLNAYVNTTKHKSLISSPMSASFGPDNRGGIKIDSFSYSGKDGDHHFDSKWAYDFLFKENQSIRCKLVDVGKSLIEQFT